MSDTGSGFPLLLDDPLALPGCWHAPGPEPTFAEHLRQHYGQSIDGPYPLQLVVAPDGTIAYLSRGWDPEALIAALEGLVPGATSP